MGRLLFNLAKFTIAAAASLSLGMMIAVIAVIATANAALAAPSDFSFAATTLGITDPTWEVILNAFFWLGLTLGILGVVLEIFRRPKVRDRYTAAEYNEAVGLRRLFVPDGGAVNDDAKRPQMSVGEALYMVGVIAVERLFAFGVIALIVWAAVS